MRSRLSIGSFGVLLIVSMGCVVLAAGSASGNAGLPVGAVGLCGTATIGAMPADLEHSAAVNRAVQVIPEAISDSQAFPFQLTSPVPVDVAAVGVYDRPAALPSPQPVILPVGTFASFLVHWDPPGDMSVPVRTVTIGFNASVVGVQVLASTVASTASQQFHAPHVTYPSGAGGLDLAPDGSGDVVRVLDRNTVSISFTGLGTVKEFRIITTGEGEGATSSGVLGPGPGGSGYTMLGADGGVFVFEPAGYQGSLGGTRLNQPIVGGTRTCGGEGYWLVARDGGVFSFGDAPFYGSLGSAPPAAPVVAMTATATGGGYDLVTSTGEVSPFGDAHFYGDARDLHLNKPIVGIAATPTGHGYWLVASDGGVFAFGDAAFDGSTGGIHLNRPVVGMRAAPSGDGYYLFASDGGVFAFRAVVLSGPVPFFGSAGAIPDALPLVGMRVAADGQGYWLTDSAGKVFGFGPSAPSGPGVSGTTLASPVIGML